MNETDTKLSEIYKNYPRAVFVLENSRNEVLYCMSLKRWFKKPEPLDYLFTKCKINSYDYVCEIKEQDFQGTGYIIKERKKK